MSEGLRLALDATRKRQRLEQWRRLCLNILPTHRLAQDVSLDELQESDEKLGNGKNAYSLCDAAHEERIHPLREGFIS